MAKAEMEMNSRSKEIMWMPQQWCGKHAMGEREALDEEAKIKHILVIN